MSYSNNQEAIRNALWNFIGQLLSSSIYSEDMAKQSVVALISEELCKLCKNDDETINMIVAKPILKSSNWIINQRANNIKDKAKEINLIANTDDLDTLAKSIDDYINKIK